MTYIPEGPLGVLYFNAVLSTSNIERLNLPSLMSSPHVGGSLPQPDTTIASPPQQRVQMGSPSDSVISQITATLTGRKRGLSSSSQVSNETLSLTVEEEFQEMLVKQKELLRFMYYDFIQNVLM